MTTEISTLPQASARQAGDYELYFTSTNIPKKKNFGYADVKVLVVDGTTRIKVLDATDFGWILQSYGIDNNYIQIDPQNVAAFDYSKGNPWFEVERLTNGLCSVLPGANQAAFTASIAGTTLTVTAKASGTIAAGQTLNHLSLNFVPGTTIVAQLTGTAGGIGTYSLSDTQTVASEAMTTGVVLNNPSSLELIQGGPKLRWRSCKPNVWSVSF